MTNAAIVGCGDVATVHAEALEALASDLGIKFVAVVDKDLETAEKFATGLGAAGDSSESSVKAYGSLPALFAKGKIDVLRITTPHDQHIGLALEALHHGVNVILEKPLANELDQAQRLIDYLDENPDGPKIAVCYQNRYNVSSQELRRLLDSGELGAINGAYSSVVWTRTPGYYTQKPWRGQQAHSGGDLLMNQAIHTLDLLQCFLGEATEVKGTVSTDKYADVIDVEDTAHAYIRHEPGVHTSEVN